MITYTPDIIENTIPVGFRVELDRKVVGRIRKVKGGYQYFPKGYVEGGEITTLDKLKYILEIGNK